MMNNETGMITPAGFQRCDNVNNMPSLPVGASLTSAQTVNYQRYMEQRKGPMHFLSDDAKSEFFSQRQKNAIAQPLNPQLNQAADANKPYIVVPGSLEAVFNKGAISTNDVSVKMDCIMPPGLDDSEIAKLEADMAQIDEKLKQIQESTKFKALQIEGLVRECNKLTFELSSPSDYKTIDLTILNANVDAVDTDILSVLRHTNTVLSHDSAAISAAIANNRTEISQLTAKIENDLKTLVALQNERVGKQAKLLQAQAKYIRTFAANPPRILSGDEIVANYMQNALLGDD